MSAVTQWFGPDQPPVHVGWYDTTKPHWEKGTTLRLYWSGLGWHFSDKRLNYRLFGPTRHWRGLAEKPA